MKSLILFLTGMLLAAAVYGGEADGDAVLLSIESESVNPVGSVRYFLDAEGNLDVRDALQEEFLLLENNDIDFGFTADKIWLRFGVENTSSESLEKILTTSSRFMRPLEIYLYRDSQNIERLLYNDETHKFGERPLPEFRFLAAEFTLQAFEEATFLIRFGAGGQATMGLEITSREQALTEQFSAAIGIATFVSVLSVLIMVNFFHYLALRKAAYLFYIFYESMNMLYVAHMEGFTWQYLWPNLPALNADATPIISALGILIGNVFALVFLESWKYTPRLHRVLQFFIAISALILVITLLFNNRIGNQITAPMLPLSLLLNTVIAAVAIRRGHYLARYFLVAWGMWAVMAAIWSGNIMGYFSVSFDILTVYKISISIQAIILSMGLADQVRRLNNHYIETQHSLIENLNGRLQDAKERIRLEKENEESGMQLLQKSKQLATASHDINQPIQSLRLTLDALKRVNPGDESAVQLSSTLDHMESVLGSALDEASEDLKKSSKNSAINSLVIGSLIVEIVDQFSPQAQEKNISLQGYESKAVVVTQPMPLKRCLMNLVSNAIKATAEGGVLLGVRRRGSKVEFQVFDTGVGITEDDFGKIMQPLVTGDGAVGHGLGLAIVAETCAEYDWEFSMDSILGCGSRFSVSIPIRI